MMEQKLVIKTTHEESFSGRAAFWTLHTATTLHTEPHLWSNCRRLTVESKVKFSEKQKLLN